MDQSFITSPYFYKHITCRAGQISYSFFFRLILLPYAFILWGQQNN